jgi:hypothetical protein
VRPTDEKRREEKRREEKRREEKRSEAAFLPDLPACLRAINIVRAAAHCRGRRRKQRAEEAEGQ